MAHDWIIGVLADLKTYTDRHRLEDLSDRLQAALSVAHGTRHPNREPRGTDAPLTDHVTRRVADRAGGRH